ncbi:MAG: hypothetical protein HOY69_22230 [Streptomyces sp.]|nr:hypothetical protein [Streptomyces sp.]
MSVPTLAVVSADDPFERLLADAEAKLRASLLADYRAAVRSGDVIDLDWTRYEIQRYDEARPGQPPLVDELAGFDYPAAA